MLSAMLKEVGTLLKCTVYISPEGEAVVYEGEHPENIDPVAAVGQLGNPVWTGRVEADAIVAMAGIPGPATCYEQLQGTITLALAEHVQSRIIAGFGPLGIPEACETYCDASRAIINGMVCYYKEPLLGLINIHNDRMAVVAGEKSPFFSVPDTSLHNFCADFVIPPKTEENEQKYEELAGLIRLWNAPKNEKQDLLNSELAWYARQEEHQPLVEELLCRIEALGGYMLRWK